MCISQWAFLEADMIISLEEKLAAMTEKLFLIKMYCEVRDPVHRVLFKSPSQRLFYYDSCHPDNPSDRSCCGF